MQPGSSRRDAAYGLMSITVQRRGTTKKKRSIALRKEVENQVMNFISRPLPKLFPLPEIPFLFSDFWKNPTHASRPNS